MQLPKGKSRLELVREGLVSGVSKRGRLIVSVDRLLEDPKNERKTFRNMEGLVESIKAVGVVEPITVTQVGDKFRILTGHRRARAAKLANLREVEILIREDEDELLRRRKSLISNVQREDIGAIELAEALRAMLDEEDQLSQRDLAKILGKREAWISDMLRLLSLPAEIQQKLRHADVSIPYDTLMRIARIADEKVQSELVYLALGGTAAPALRKRIDQFKDQTTAHVRRARKIQRFSVSRDGYTATVSGPAGQGAYRQMQAAVAELHKKLESSQWPKAA